MAGSKGSKYYDIFLDYAILLEHKELGTILTPDKFKLLNAIHKTESLKEACKDVGISYRKAWGNIEEMESKLNFKLVIRKRGGSQGGQTQLSSDGIKLIEAHKKLRTKFDNAIKSITKEFFQDLNETVI